MEHPNFFVYLAIDLLVVSVVAMILRRILAIYGRKKHSKKQLESFLANLAESYYKAYYKHGFSSNGSNMRKSIERDMSSKFNYLFSYLPYFPKSFDKDYIDKEAGLFVDRMIPVLEFLHASTLTDKASRPTIQTLQKIFFDRMEIEIINHLHSSI